MVIKQKIKTGIDLIKRFLAKYAKGKINSLPEVLPVVSASHGEPSAAWQQIRSEIDYLHKSFDDVIRDTQSWGEAYGNWLDQTENQLAQARAHIKNMGRGRHSLQSRQPLGQVYDANSGLKLRSVPENSKTKSSKSSDPAAKNPGFDIDQTEGPAYIDEKSARAIWAKIDNLRQAFSQTSLSANLLGIVNTEALRHRDERLTIAEGSINELNLRLCDTQKKYEARLADALHESKELKDRVSELSQTLAQTEFSCREIESKRYELEIQKNNIEQLLKNREDEFRRTLEENDRASQGLQARLAQKDEEIQNLRDHHEEFKRELASLEASKRSLEAECEALKTSKSDLDRLLKVREDEFARISQNDRQVRSGLEEEITKLRADCKTLQEHAQTAIKNTGAAEVMRFVAEKERDQLKAANGDQELIIQAQQSEITRLAGESGRIGAENQAELEDARREVQKLQSEINDLTLNIACLEKEKSAAGDAQSEAVQKQRELEDSVKKRDTEIAGLREEIRHIREGFEAELTGKQQVLADMQSRLAQLTRRLEDVAAQSRELESGRDLALRQKEEVEASLRAREALWQQASGEQQLLCQQLEQSLGVFRTEAQLWKNQTEEMKIRLESMESEKKSAVMQRDVLSQKIDELENQQKIQNDTQLKVDDKTIQDRREIEAKLAAVNSDKERWQKQTQELMNQIEALESNRRLVQLEREELETKKSELEKLLTTKDAEQANLIQVKDGYSVEINHWKSTCKKMEEDMFAAREAFVRRLALCTEEIEEWKRKAAQNDSKSEKPEFFPEESNGKGVAVESNCADSILKQALDKARAASAAKGKTPDPVPVEEKPEDLHSDASSGIYELRRFQEIVEKG